MFTLNLRCLIICLFILGLCFPSPIVLGDNENDPPVHSHVTYSEGFSACVYPSPIFQISLKTGCVTVGYEIPGYFQTWTTCTHGKTEPLTCRCTPFGPGYYPCGSSCYEQDCNYQN